MYENPLFKKQPPKHQGKGPKGYKRRDDRIHDEICEHLTHHPLIDASTMDVHVKDGEVTLTGEVTDRRMKHLAEDAVDQVSGVREIHNQLRVFRDRVA
jgi:osmotically-inducible protein OsmY